MKSLLAALATAILLAPLDAQTPTITSIDPPDWFVQLPDPMLLVHGAALDQAKFTVEPATVTLEKSQASANGHWAFLWLKTASAQPVTVRITATTPAGAVTRDWQLKPRTEPAEAHRGFTPADVIYLVMTDRFADGNPANNNPPSDPGGFDRSRPKGWHGGDLAGLLQHLDYIQSLGATALWTTPIYSNGAMPDSYHGYAATDLYAVDPHFGSLDEYKQLSAALHARGMKLIIDMVPNHIGSLNPQLADQPTPGWIHGTAENHVHSEGDFNSLVDPHAPPAASRQLVEGWFVDAMPDMNQDNPLTAKYLIQNALWWVETAQIDAIRIDTFPYVPRGFWRDFHAALHTAYPNLRTVGEIFNGDPAVTSFFAGGRDHSGIDTGLDTPFDFPTYFAIRDTLVNGKPMTRLAETLRQDQLYPHPERLVHFFGNHDTSRFLTAVDGSLDRLRLAFGLIATLRGTPEVYSGDEVAMTGGDDPDNRHEFPGGFPPLGGKQLPSAFDPATRSLEQRSTFLWASGLFALRRTHPVLATGAQQDLFADDTGFAYLRTEHLDGCKPGSEALLAVLNKGGAARTIALPLADTALANCTRFTPLDPANSGKATLSGGKLEITLPTETFALFTVN